MKATGIILCGGKSSRMGTNKALIKFQGEKLINRAVRILKRLFCEIILVTNTPDIYSDQDVRIVTDIIPGAGALGGIFTGLFYAGCEYAFICACDLPFLDKRFIEFMRSRIERHDVVIPRSHDGLQPLYAFYSTRCLQKIERQILWGDMKITDFFKGLKVFEIPAETIAAFDPHDRIFFNINTPEDMEKFPQ